MWFKLLIMLLTQYIHIMNLIIRYIMISFVQNFLERKNSRGNYLERRFHAEIAYNILTLFFRYAIIKIEKEIIYGCVNPYQCVNL